MNIKISADSTCDLSAALIGQYDIGIAPLHIIKGKESFADGIEITPKEVFEYFDSEGGICQTAAVNIEEYIEFFGELLKTCDAIVHFTISSEMSACYQSACLAAEELENVYVIDSRNLSTGIGHLVLDAALMAREGLPASEIYEKLTAKRGKLEVSFVLNTLKFLHKGGRCSAVAALGANLLQLKPCIEVKDGKMDVGKKYRGSLEKCLMQYVDDRLKDRNDIEYSRIFVTHSGVDPVICKMVLDRVAELGHFGEVYETQAGCTISSHCGPNCLGLLFYRK